MRLGNASARRRPRSPPRRSRPAREVLGSFGIPSFRRTSVTRYLPRYPLRADCDSRCDYRAAMASPTVAVSASACSQAICTSLTTPFSRRRAGARPADEGVQRLVARGHGDEKAHPPRPARILRRGQRDSAAVLLRLRLPDAHRREDVRQLRPRRARRGAQSPSATTCRSGRDVQLLTATHPVEAAPRRAKWESARADRASVTTSGSAAGSSSAPASPSARTPSWGRGRSSRKTFRMVFSRSETLRASSARSAEG